MSYISKKDTQLLLNAGFDESDLGLSGGRVGIQLYETPGDYFAKEIIENACERGECDLYDEILPPATVEPYDNSRKGLYEDDVYPGLEDPIIDVRPELRQQAEFLKEINIGKMALWQKRDGDFFKWPVKRINIDLPDEAKSKLNRLGSDDRKLLFKSYARDAWQELWGDAVSSLSSVQYDLVEINARGKNINLIALEADMVRELGHKVPGEASWITMLYFHKDNIKPLIRPRNHL